MKAFLSSRQQVIVLKGQESDTVPVTPGVPQGHILGGLILFSVFINVLSQDIVSEVRPFADETAIYLTLEKNDDTSSLQKDLDQLQVWGIKWDMEF